jgi:predicted GNAT family N-acyltransferase
MGVNQTLIRAARCLPDHPLFRVVTTPADILKAYSVRSIVFLEEQACSYAEEFDGLDAGAVHIVGEEQDEPVAVGRIRFLGDAAKLERIALRAAVRGRGLGHQLVDFMVEVAHCHGFRTYTMHAQAHLVRFYHQHGFNRRGDLFQEAGIDHYLMVRQDDRASTSPTTVPSDTQQ